MKQTLWLIACCELICSGSRKRERSGPSGRVCSQVLLIASYALAIGFPGLLYAQSAGEKVLLAKAQSLVADGHLELAVQTWQQVLLSDPGEREALLGIAKADMELGNTQEAQKYLQRLRDLGGRSAELAKIEAMPRVQPQSVRLAEARRLAQQGRSADAMKVYRDLYPHGPPAGEMALEFYETEAGLPELRREAIERLQELASQFSADARYAIVLGRILTYDPKTRAQGIALLSRFDKSSEAQQALKQALRWNDDGGKQAADASAAHGNSPRAEDAFADPIEASAYRALNSGHLDVAEQQFTAVLSKQPSDARALSGLGYVEMKRGNFTEALGFLERARAAGATNLEGAISTARFWNRMAQASSEQKAGDAQSAAKDYRDALALKPGNHDAEEALVGALMQAGNTPDAAAILKRELAVNPENESDWRNLFLAQAQTADWRDALATAQRTPKNIEARLETDPEYLRFLIQGYAATKDKQGESRTTELALGLPFPNHGRDLPLDKQLQYAGLLMVVQRFEPALRLYRQVLDIDPGNVGAWVALIAAEHQLDHDDEALATVRGMPQAAYEEGQKDAGFLVLLASIYRSRNELANAEKYLEQALSIPGSSQPRIKLQLAEVYLAQGEQQKAYSIYRRELDENPNSTDSWRGLLASLHQSNRDRDALREVSTMPATVRLALEQDSSYLQTLASIQSAAGQDKAALQTFDVIMQVYLDQETEEPADVQIQYGWLLLKAGDDRRLYSVVSKLAKASDLTENQQANRDKLWASWSIRRANSALARGEQQRAIAILETAAKAFPGDVDVYNTLAGSYLQAGQPKRALAIYASLDLRRASLAQYHGAIGAALAAHDLKQAEVWLQAALNIYDHDAALLKMAAQYEQAKGDVGRAATYYRAALDAMGPESPAEIFTHAATADRANDDPARGNSAPTRELMRLLAPSSAKDQSDDGQDGVESKREADVSWREGPRGKSSTLGDFGPSEAADRHETSSSVVREEVRRPSADNNEVCTTNLASASPSSEDFSSVQTSPRKSASKRRRPSLACSSQGNGGVSAIPSLGDLNVVEASWNAASPTEPIKRVSFELPLRGAYIRAPEAAAGAQASAVKGKSRADSRLPADDPEGSSEEAGKLQDAANSLKAPSRSAGVIPFKSNSQLSDYNEHSYTQLDDFSDLPKTGAAVNQLASATLPPLTGAIVSSQAALTPREQIQQQLAVLEAGSSSWIGGTSTLDYRTGQPGFDQLATYSGQAERSTMLASGARTTFIVRPVLLDAGQATGTETIRQGTLPLTVTPYVQSAAGIAGEFELQTANFGARVGTTPRGFLVQNYTGGLSIHPVSAHFTLDFSRDPILDTQLSFAGLRDEGSRTSTSVGNTWGGVIANAGEVKINSGDASSGWYVQAGGQYITGLHVATNERIDGDSGAYWSAWHNSQYGSLVAGVNFFGMHYQRNLRYFTYGQGGYFSPGAYMLAALPLTFTGHYGAKFHYVVIGSLGMQAFQEDSAPFFPLDPAYQGAQGNPSYPERISVGGNYNLETEGSYSIADHWYIGTYASFNNSRDYASDKVGFFVRFLTRSQPTIEENGPTGLFPIQGMRPWQTP